MIADVRSSLTPGGWPAVGYEPRPWAAEPSPFASRRQSLRARGPYSAAVPATIARLTPTVDSALAARAEEALTELSRFDAEVGRIPAPFSAILLRSESASSSEIENLSSGARALALAELGAKSTPNARLILGNVRAMHAALELAEHLDSTAIVRMHDALLRDSQPEHVGSFRHEQVWIGGASPHSADFVAPHHERVAQGIDDLLAFADRTDLPLLSQIAIVHAQFETIHPFPDGNGRTGRALVQALLRRSGTTQHLTVPVSGGLLADTGRYFRALSAYREGSIEPIVSEFADASLAAVSNGRELVADLESIRADWARRSTSRRGSLADRLLDVLTEQPVIDGATAARMGRVTLANALLGIERLEADGVLSRVNQGARNRLWQAAEVLDALDRFAERARRRAR